MSELLRQAHAVLFPVLVTLELDDHIGRFLDNGGKSLLFGETGDEYVSGQMSAERRRRETLDAWHATVEQATARAGHLLLAADADIAAVHRLQWLTPPLPSRDDAQRMSPRELEDICFDMAKGVAQTGINLVLSPTADVVTGHNLWLNGRTLADDPVLAARMVRAYVRGVRRAGLQTTLKHFPGHPELVGHPATSDATVPLSLAELRALWAPFEAGIDEGVDAVMMGPARFEAVQPAVAASLSRELISTLRTELGFDGLVMTCDLDHRATQGDRALGDVAVAALAAGADLLLLSPKAVPRIGEVAEAIVRAVADGRVDASRLQAAFDSVSAAAGRRPA
ncbi:glycoside hydrolase family 3 N-terminal domain-containing protein [Burkholderia vietnamiensis]|uniref:glycoside hydrolase family 3 N-terminal domain-containing protein n=1 Tax=Burkholderia vietnamiensis TaxID=60552 RepID=UPI001CAEDE38|nr:glycoside hydrolase family 3 N-terminal domain-containing protein [Burkholderia vietnamiensis]CAG9223088.1 Glycoside hydrolase [Burkholderia vietnamiensis]